MLIEYFFPPDHCNDGKTLKLMASTTQSNFTSPNYPHPYPPGTSRQWLIEVPKGKFVKLEITGVSYFFCKAVTTFNVYDGDSENPTELIRNLCTKKGDDYIFQYPKLTIYSKGQKLFVSSNSLAYIQYPINNKGFQAFYSAVHGGMYVCTKNLSTQFLVTLFHKYCIFLIIHFSDKLWSKKRYRLHSPQG